MRQKTILVTGGARSGKSKFAQKLASGLGEPVLFVATAEALDEEMRERIEEHRKSRPATWETLEVRRHVGTKILERAFKIRTVLIDCIALLVNNILFDCSKDEELDPARAEKEVRDEMEELISCMRQLAANFIIVTNEVGLGIVPGERVSRLYRDLLGKANQMLAECAGEVYLLISGIPLKIK